MTCAVIVQWWFSCDPHHHAVKTIFHHTKVSIYFDDFLKISQKTSKRKQNTENLKNLFSAFVLRGKKLPKEINVEVSQRPILPSNCQTLVAEAIRRTVFFEMFLSVACLHQRVIIQEVHFMQTFNGPVFQTSTNIQYCLSVEFQI